MDVFVLKYFSAVNNRFVIPVWKIFYPLFLRYSHRQSSDPEFYDFLQNVRMGKISERNWQELEKKKNRERHKEAKKVVEKPAKPGKRLIRKNVRNGKNEKNCLLIREKRKYVL